MEKKYCKMAPTMSIPMSVAFLSFLSLADSSNSPRQYPYGKMMLSLVEWPDCQHAHLFFFVVPDPNLVHRRGEHHDNSFLLRFQSDGRPSNQTFAQYSGQLMEMSEFTICYWFRFHFYHTTMSLLSYCSPAQNCMASSVKPKCSNIRKGRKL